MPQRSTVLGSRIHRGRKKITSQKFFKSQIYFRGFGLVKLVGRRSRR